jgi:adenine-specific DNA-methyltransferase
MYPRLKLLQKLLREDGAIFISIDDNEQANLRLICDEVFGKNNFVANIVWKHTQQSKNDEKHFSRQYNYILVYSKSIDYLDRFLFDRTEEDNINYSNPDNDPNGLWRSGDVRSPNYRKTLCFPLFTPDKKKINPPKNGWRWSEESIKEKIMKGEIIFKPGGLGIIRKIYLKDQSGRTPENLWDDEIYGTTRQATALLKEIFEGNTPFNTPKPIQLLDRIIQIASTPNDIILDSFAGSGTTAHAVLNMNKDGGNRKFILVEMEDYAETITAERIRRVISGYGEGDKKTPGTGGDFTYCALGEPIFTPDGSLNPKAGEDALWRYIWYAETKTSMPDSEKTRTNQYYLGSFLNIAYYFYYNKERKTVLDYAFLKTIKKKEEQYIIYADICTLGAEYLNARNIHFRKIPRDIPRY